MRSFKLSRRIAILLALIIIAACTERPAPSAPIVPVTPPPNSLSLTNSTITLSSASLTADGASSATITVELRDQRDAAISKSEGTVVMSATAGTVGPVQDHNDGTYTAVITAPIRTGTATVTAMLGGLLFAHEISINFVAGPPSQDRSSLTIDDSVMLADGASTTQVILHLYDASGNLISATPSPVAVATTKGTLSAMIDTPTGYVSVLTSPSSVGIASVSASLNGAPFGTPISVRFASHQFWARKAAIGDDRFEMGGAAVNGTIYATGGFMNDPWDEDVSVVTEVDAYDVATNTWIQKAPMLTARYAHGVGVINGILYAVGGADANGAPLNNVEAYDPATNSWTAKAPMPTSRSGLSVSVVGGILYAVGGANTGTLRTVEAYDPAANTWTTKDSMPVPLESLGTSVVNGILYAVGSASGPSSTLYAYDPVTNSWTTKASMPAPTSVLAAGALGAKLYALGYNQVFESYDPATNGWSSQPAAQQSGVSFVSVVNGSLFAVGVFDGSQVFMFVP